MRMRMVVPLVCAALAACGGPMDEKSLQASASSDLTLYTRLEIRSSSTSKCMDTGGSFVIGTPIVQYDCHHYPDQQFAIDQASFTTFQIVSNYEPGKCVAVIPSGANQAVQSGDVLTLLPCSDATGFMPLNTRWFLDSTDLNNPGSPVSHARIRTAAPAFGTLCLDVPGGSFNNSLRLQVYTCHGGPNQLWELTTW